MKNLTNKNWWKASLIRAARTAAQIAVGYLGAATLISEVNFLELLSAAAIAGLTSILMSIAGLPEVGVESEISGNVETDSEWEEK